ncbi:MAG: 50S ribosomal protein L24 [bacterium]|nr:50S ribosomal protein L24 [bacterium]
MKIKKGDTVKIMAGKDSGKTGKVIQILPKDMKVVVDGVNQVIKHMKSQRKEEKGQRFEFFAPVDVSNVQLIDEKSKKVIRVGYKFLENGQKVRISRKTGQELD